MKFIEILMLTNFFVNCGTNIVGFGPVIRATKGEIWPKPLLQKTSSESFAVDLKQFKISVVGKTCDILDEAVKRYEEILMKIAMVDGSQSSSNLTLNTLKINLMSSCEKLPYLGMDESYHLNISRNSSELQSASIWGILRGLESFSQLIYFTGPGENLMRINATSIQDQPRFAHRGLLVDTSRHFISLNVLKQILDGMAYNKLNVFHWHIVDDHSFPYQSVRFPELSEKGAYNKRFVYSQRDVVEIIEYARLRGIRVMPEFDTPGHTASWGASHPEVLTACGSPYTGRNGPINPIKNDSYVFLKNFFSEIASVFPDKYLHLGGDEVDYNCWHSNPEIVDFMINNKIPSFKQLAGYYFQNLFDQLLVSNSQKYFMVWEEVFDIGIDLPEGSIVQIWTDKRRHMLKEVTKQKHFAILSSCWYLNHLEPKNDWKKFYECDPENFRGNREQKKMVLGGEACMWGEDVDDSNIISRIFPRVAATAEKLWSTYHVSDYTEARGRMEEHYCRLKKRGIGAQPPNGPGFCY